MKRNILEINNLNYKKDGHNYLNGFEIKVKEESIHAILFQNQESKNKLLEFLKGKSDCRQGKLLFKNSKLSQQKLRELGKEVIYFINQYSALNPKKDPLGIFKFNKKVEQENKSTVFPDMTVEENIFFGREPVKKYFFFKAIDKKKLTEKTLDLLDLLEVKIYPEQKMAELTPLKKQLVELLKALSYQAEIIVVDQAVVDLNKSDKEVFLKFMQKLKEKGFSILYFTKEIEEVFAAADRVSVLKDGKNKSTAQVSELEYNELALLLMGK
ncbi:MAG: ATP-binding cassette domain-containing protein [Halanaerobium sp.]